MPLLSCKFILLYGRYFNCVNKVVGSVFSVADGAVADTYGLYMNENKATACDSHHKHNSANK